MLPLRSQHRLSSCCRGGGGGVSRARSRGPRLPAPASRTHLGPQEHTVRAPRRPVPDDQQAPAVADEDPGGVPQVSLEGFHGAQRLPTPVVVRHAAEGRR